jgi:hypothetical protein
MKMNRHVLLALVSAGVTASVGSFGAGARAWASTTWTRTIDGSVCLPDGNGGFACPFVSDTLVNGTFGGAGGNGGVAAVYADVQCATTAGSVLVQACGHSFDNSGGSCGSTVSVLCNSGPNPPTLDVGANLWHGTGNPWDYFYVSVHGWGEKVIGIAASGTD